MCGFENNNHKNRVLIALLGRVVFLEELGCAYAVQCLQHTCPRKACAPLWCSHRLAQFSNAATGGSSLLCWKRLLLARVAACRRTLWLCLGTPEGTPCVPTVTLPAGALRTLQCAEVEVNGRPAGVMYTAGRNAAVRRRRADLLLHPALFPAPLEGPAAASSEEEQDGAVRVTILPMSCVGPTALTDSTEAGSSGSGAGTAGGGAAWTEFRYQAFRL